MKLLPFIVLILLTATVHAQVQLSGELTYGTYKMSSLKTFQQDVIQQSGLPLHVVTDFPPYFGFGLTATYPVSPRLVVGFAGNFNSTGSRAYYEDYSGMARLDQLLKALSVGALVRSKVNKSEIWPVWVSMQVSWVMTTAHIESEETIGSQTNTSTLELKSNNIGLRPGIFLQRILPGGFFASAQIGYEVQIDAHLRAGMGETNLTAQWDGLRAGLGIGYTFGSKTSTQP